LKTTFDFITAAEPEHSFFGADVFLEHPNRLLMIPAHDPVPRKDDGGLHWDAITAVEITEITDTHD
jgi:hypothetical protein